MSRLFSVFYQSNAVDAIRTVERWKEKQRQIGNQTDDDDEKCLRVERTSSYFLCGASGEYEQDVLH